VDHTSIRKRGNGESDTTMKLRHLYNRPDIVNEIKRKRPEWAGHVCRKPEALAKTVLQEGPSGKILLRKAATALGGPCRERCCRFSTD